MACLHLANYQSALGWNIFWDYGTIFWVSINCSTPFSSMLLSTKNRPKKFNIWHGYAHSTTVVKLPWNSGLNQQQKAACVFSIKKIGMRTGVPGRKVSSS
jgi:hypothetical protein